MQQPMEIHIKDNKCKVIVGEHRRSFYSTEEAVGLALLRLNPTAGGANIELRWEDYLADRGVAMALAGDKVLTLLVLPSVPRSISYRGGGAAEEYLVTYPTMLMATAFKDRKLIKTSLWCVKPGTEKKLSVTSTDNVLGAFPYGNVYSHGGICWGTTPLKDLRTPMDVVGAFFGSGFNGDLFTPQHMNPAPSGRLREMLVSKVTPPLATNVHTKSVQAVGQDLLRG